MVIVYCMCALGMYVCFNVHVYDEYFYVSMHVFNICVYSIDVCAQCMHIHA